MSLSRKILLISSLALAGLGGLLYTALSSILSQGPHDQMVVSYVAVSVVVAGGGFFLVTLLLMNQLVLTRLARLRSAVHRISSSEDFSRRLEIDERDELASVALEINHLLQSCQRSHGIPTNGQPESSAPAPETQVVDEPEQPQATPTFYLDTSLGSSRVPLLLDWASADSQLVLPFSSQAPEPSSSEWFRDIFRAAPVPLAICSVDGERCREANESFLKLVGLEQDEVIGRNLGDLEIWAEPAGREQWHKLIAQKQPVREFGCRLKTRSGDCRETLASLEWVKLENEPCFLFAACDLTSRLHQEVEIRQTQRMEAVGQLAAGFAHDFNNILAIVQGYTSILLTDKALDAQASKALKEVSAAAVRAADLTRQLLTFSRKQIMQPKTLDLNRVLQGLENTLQRMLGESSAVKYNLAPDALPIRADVGMLEQLVVNLAVNARESMPRGGQLTVSTANVEITPEYVSRKQDSRVGRFTCLTFTDTGCGFEPANLNRIFEPFFSAKGRARGTGLGLATVYGIVKQHNGWIEVTSQPGHGTTFKIFLPSEAKVASVTKAPVGVQGGKERILLVEDEPGLCTMVEGILRRYGYTVVSAPNGVDAIHLWNKHRGEFDLLLTDMVMPEGLTGQQLAEKLKAQNQNLKVIYSSGYTADLVGADGTELTDGLNFLQKPYHPQKLAQTVRSCLDAVEKEKPVLTEAVA
jgi:PAS domain S-box-containing protein